MNAFTKTFQMPDGRQISIETGKLARQAHGSVVVRMGNTMLLATVVSDKNPKEGIDFLPLSVDYQEKFAAAGKIPGGFLKREGKLSDYEVLISRLVDRACRPLFPDNYYHETQINIWLISADSEAQPDCLAALAASAALTISDIPFEGPISEVRVARIDGKFCINPGVSENERADIDLIVAATMENIMMVEGAMKEVSEEDMLEALRIAHDAIKIQCQAQLEMRAALGVTARDFDSNVYEDADLKKMVFEAVYDKLFAVAKEGSASKSDRKDAFKVVKDEFLNSLPSDHTYNVAMLKKYLASAEKKAARNLTLETGMRLDGRQTTQVRPIWSEIDYLPSAHGSAIFTRGETQSLTSVTLGTKLDEQMIDRAMFKGFNRFILHYNFPGFSTGEVKPNRGPGRREVGHGNLAWRALHQVMPADGENPYTVRVVSDILESNGSSSMATVCAGSLALMDAGVKIKKPVSGIAMGMISDSETGKYAILSDILGDEDHLGDMDFKVTGTEDGITACQMDIKIDGLSYEVLRKALMQAREGRMHILNEMKKTISETRPDLKPHAPRAVTIEIPRDMIGAVIGPGGKVVQDIQNTTGTTVVIEEVPTGGLVNIFAIDQASMDKAVKRVRAIVALPEIGEVYDGIVKSIMPFGAFVEFMPGKDGLLHISEITWERLEAMDGVMEVGEEVKVKLVEIDERTGKFRLSRKVLLPKPANMPERPERSGEPRGDRDRDGERGNRGGGDRRGGDRREGGDRRGGDRNK